MSSIDLASLGFTKEELQERVVARIADDILTSSGFDDDGEPVAMASGFKKQVAALVTNRVDDAVATLCKQVVDENFADYLSRVQLQRTTHWGEKKGDPMSFVDFITHRAHEYLNEQVDREGKPKNDSYFRPETTRAMWLTNAAVHKNIIDVMNQCLTGHNNTVGEAIAIAVKTAIDNVKTSFKVTTTTERK
jgi:hypothetical protein